MNRSDIKKVQWEYAKNRVGIKGNVIEIYRQKCVDDDRKLVLSFSHNGNFLS